jgi:ion channel-forming bestrophin family protein
MIAYNPKDWLSFIFKFHKADTFRQLVQLIAIIGAYTAIVVVIDQHILELTSDSRASKITLMHSLLGFALSMLLVFRTNTAYERWWEGRKLWGALVNCSRNLAVKVHVMVEDKRDREQFRQILVIFPFTLKNHLRKSTLQHENELDVHEFFHDVSQGDHLPVATTKKAYALLEDLRKTKKISGEQLLVLNNEMQQYLEICGACERISNTPIPYSYSVFLKKFIFFYTMTLPIALAPVLSYYAIPIVIFIFYVLASLELIAEEIENPFGTDANDLPLDQICSTIKKNVDGILL